jgi:hypothetical protein
VSVLQELAVAENPAIPHSLIETIVTFEAQYIDNRPEGKRAIDALVDDYLNQAEDNVNA